MTKQNSTYRSAPGVQSAGWRPREGAGMNRSISGSPPCRLRWYLRLVRRRDLRRCQASLGSCASGVCISLLMCRTCRGRWSDIVWLGTGWGAFRVASSDVQELGFWDGVGAVEESFVEHGGRGRTAKCGDADRWALGFDYGKVGSVKYSLACGACGHRVELLCHDLKFEWRGERDERFGGPLREWI